MSEMKSVLFRSMDGGRGVAREGGIFRWGGDVGGDR